RVIFLVPSKPHPSLRPGNERVGRHPVLLLFLCQQTDRIRRIKPELEALPVAVDQGSTDPAHGRDGAYGLTSAGRSHRPGSAAQGPLRPGTATAWHQRNPG